MRSPQKALRVAVVCVIALGAFAGCESESGSAAPTDAGYYAAGAYDPWYYGDYDDPDNIATIPPGSRPEAPPRPAHPIALPPPPRAQPLPGIPMRPRPAFRR
jgi:hypothetical protein